ncbi:hypothetical protein JW998_00605 [candidate division KSB1 bacterium]|nr:hypothetical protein [candidate division KSB1 bacterium]
MNKFTVILPMLIILFGACSKKESASVQFHPNISAHTAGQISRFAPVRIVFTDHIVQAEQIGAAIEPSPFSFKPRIKGITVWADERTIEFRPAERLPQGQQYEAKFNLRDIMFVEQGETEFTFSFTTVKQSIDMRLDGLSADGSENLSKQKLSGTIELADEETPHDVENILSAEMDGKKLAIRWLEQQNNRLFRFAVTGISRQENSSHVILKWDGSPVGVDDKGEIAVDVPGLNTFAVLNARPVRDDREYVELRFSDPLKRTQELTGLITIKDHPDTRFTITENVIAVYSSSPFVGDVQVTVSPGISNVLGRKITTESAFTVTFAEYKPQARFVGSGAIIPTTHGLTIPIETVNLRAVIISAMLINDQKIPQFLQVNNLKGDQELERVGHIIWRNVVNLDPAANKLNQWIRYGLDITPLIEKNPRGIYRLSLSFQKEHITCRCSESDEIKTSDLPVDPGNDDMFDLETRYYYGQDYEEYWTNRTNPCHPAYYFQWYDHNIVASQNFLISDLALIAKRGDNDSLFVAVTDIKSAEPKSNVSLEVLDFQQNTVGSGSTNSDGIAMLKTSKKPFLLIARDGEHSSYLKLQDGTSQTLSHFDVSGETIVKGIRGFIYGERGVWRPGDPIYLTFILLYDELPSNHPVRFQLYNPRNQLVESSTMTTSVNGFYRIQTKTAANAPTGDWLATVQVGGVTFSKSLQVETVMPNRLKITLDMENKKELFAGDISGTLSATWLHGAAARELQAEIELDASPLHTTWPDFKDYCFDDPAITFESESQQIYKGTLDENGSAAFSKRVDVKEAPGMLQARFTTRVFEPGGAFSSDYLTMPFHPFQHYVGLQFPDTDEPDYIYTDSSYTINMVRVTAHGAPTEKGRIELKLYKIHWRWWWEKEGNDVLADYITEKSYRPQMIDTLTLSDGKGQWRLRLDEPAYGRYYLRIRDLDGAHSSGVIFYADSRDWWRRGDDQAPGGVSVLTFAADKEEYHIGDKVNLTIPTAATGRGLLSIESGSRILKTDWFTANGDEKRYSFQVTPDMAPNVYVHVSFLQPHLQLGNDLPIRLYGVIPIHIINPKSVLEPQIICDDLFRPESSVSIRVREKNNLPMTYTLAIVDEGLLDLTHFKTPDPWGHFYRRQALGVKTWDMYDMVAGAYGGKLEKLLAIGGGEKTKVESPRKANRFPPMVQFYGPFELKKGATNNHDIDIPQYVGSVRIMVVAGYKKSFGAAEKTTPIRKPLMVLGTLPRVVTINERVSLPVSVFALEDNIVNVRVRIAAHGPLTVDGDHEKDIQFAEKGDQLVNFDIQCDAIAGVAKLEISAQSGAEKAQQTIEIDVRNPMHEVVDIVDATLEGGKSWRKQTALAGTAGTNLVTLEVSRIPPINLGRRLGFLIRYPYGCVEQTISSVFPQLYLNRLVSLSQDKQRLIQQNVTAGIDRLRHFQTSDGGFSYWPGESAAQEWVSNYAGHFAVEAALAGYNVPSGLLDQWKTYQRRKARTWVTGETNSELIQAYRLYTLALAGEADLGAMNRLKERPDLPTTAKWSLAAAYKLAGQEEAARSLARGDINVQVYRELSNTYGSDVRDKAMILETLTLLQDRERAQDIVKELSAALSSDRWMSTQTTAFALIAIARFAGLSGAVESSATFSYSWQNGPEQHITTSAPLFQQSLAVEHDSVGVIALVNKGDYSLYPRLIMQGTPRLGSEKNASNGLACTVAYLDKNEHQIDISSLAQGTDIVLQVTVKNIGTIGKYDEIALAYLVPSAWEIHNERLAGADMSTHFDHQDIRDDRVYTFFDLDQGEAKVIRLLCNASYNGRFYHPPIAVEAMYDAKINARIKGQWIEVTTPGK